MSGEEIKLIDWRHDGCPVIYKGKVYNQCFIYDCGVIDKKSRISQSEFVCTSCGSVSHADINAAKNILSKGVAISRQREAVACSLTEKSIQGTSVTNNNESKSKIK